MASSEYLNGVTIKVPTVAAKRALSDDQMLMKN